jgi:hypothetical protein
MKKKPLVGLSGSVEYFLTILYKIGEADGGRAKGVASRSARIHKARIFPGFLLPKILPGCIKGKFSN